MTNKNRNRRKVVVKQPKQPSKPKKVTPFSDVGAIVGSKLGSLLAMPYLKGVGKWLGSGIGQVFGSGDYQVVGAEPTYNVLMNSQIPKFSTTRQTNVICHREYLGDILGTAGFNNIAYPLNPGVSKTFPWLSVIAQNYQQYKFHGVIFEFRPLITDFVTNGAPGVVIMATNYNADAVIYNTKQEMENSEYAVSVKPTRELLHGIECDSNQTTISELYVRTGAPPVGQDLRLYDLGNFQFATQVNPIQNLGELWVSYCVEFFKPILPTDVGGNVLSAFTTRTTITNATPFGSSVVIPVVGDLDMSFTTNIMSFTANPGNAYFVTFTWNGVAAVWTPPATSFIGLKLANNSFAGAGNPTNGPPAGVLTGIVVYEFIVTCTALAPGIVSMTLGAAGSYPTAATMSVTITGFSTEAVL
jgi:hypothetical protein